MTNDSPFDQLLEMKSSLLATTATRGWEYIKKFAETVLRELERKALNEEDDLKASGFRRDAKGARAHWEDLLTRIELAKSLDPDPTQDNFLEIVCD